MAYRRSDNTNLNPLVLRERLARQTQAKILKKKYTTQQDRETYNKLVAQGNQLHAARQKTDDVASTTRNFNDAYTNLYNSYRTIHENYKNNIMPTQDEIASFKGKLTRANNAFNVGEQKGYFTGKSADKLKSNLSEFQSDELIGFYDKQYENASEDSIAKKKKNVGEKWLNYLSSALSNSAQGNMANAAPTQRNIQAAAQATDAAGAAAYDARLAQLDLDIARQTNSNLQNENTIRELKSQKDWNKLSQRNEKYMKDGSYGYLNSSEDEKMARAANIAAGGKELSGAGEQYINEDLLDVMTADEKAAYNYIYAKQGKKAAKEYLDLLASGDAGIRALRHTAEKAKNTAEAVPFATGGLRLLSQIPEGIASIGSGVAGLVGDKTLENKLMQASVGSAAAGEKLTEMTEEWSKGKPLSGHITKGGKDYGNIYTIAQEYGTEAVRSMISSYLLSGNFAATFSSKAAGGRLAQGLINIPIAASGYGDTYYKARENGASEYDAKKESIVSGGIEWLTEFMGGFFGAEMGGFLGALGNEPLEEWTGDILNIGYDILDSYMHSKPNEFEQEYKELIDDGHTVKEAVTIMLKRHATEEAITFLGTAFSTAPAVVGHTAIQKNTYAKKGAELRNNKDAVSYNSILKVAETLPTNTEANKLAAKLRSSKRLSNASIGELYYTTLTDVEKTFDKAKSSDELTKLSYKVTDAISELATSEVADDFSAAISNSYMKALNKLQTREASRREDEQARLLEGNYSTPTNPVVTHAEEEKTAEPPTSVEIAQSKEAPKATFNISVAKGGQPMAITSVVQTNENDGLVFQTNSGQTVKFADVDFENPATDKIVSDALEPSRDFNITLGKQGTNEFIKRMLGTANVLTSDTAYTTMSDDAKTLYSLGYTNIPYNAITNNTSLANAIDRLGAPFAKAMYDAGVADSELETSVKDKASRTNRKANKKTTGKASGKYENDTGNKDFDKLGKAFSKAFGIDIYFGEYDNKANGRIITSKGQIEIYDGSKRGATHVLGHEGIGEVLRAYNRQDYNQIVDTILEYGAELSGAKNVASLIKAYYDAYLADDKNTTIQDAREELANDLISALVFGNEAGQKAFAEHLASKQDKSLIEKFKDFVQKIIDTLNQYLNRENLSDVEKSMLELDKERAEALVKEIMSAMDTAAENARQGGAVESSESKFSLDAEYLKAVENGDEQKAQQLVDEAAMEWGAFSEDGKIPLKLYHGTQNFGFTEFDLNRMDDKRSIFLTSDLNTAATYSSRYEERKISDNSDIQRDYDSMSLEEYAELLNEDDDIVSPYKYWSKDKIEKRLSAKEKNFNQLEEIYEEWLNNEFDNFYNAYNGDIYSIKHYDSAKKDILYRLQTAIRKRDVTETVRSLSYALTSLMFNDSYDNYFNSAYNIFEGYRQIARRDISDGLIVSDNGDGYPTFLDKRMARRFLEADDKEKYKKGNYSLYAKLNNPLIVDVKGNNWKNIPAHENKLTDNNGKLYKKDIATTRDIAKFAHANGYDGVVLKNIRDDGGRGKYSSGIAERIIIAFKPKNVKSADAVTYDNDGKVIPLDERFTEDKDIRYSLNVDSEGNKLTEQQQEYFADSKVRDENGALKVVYHGTVHNFNIFDRQFGNSEGDWGKGFYFTTSYDNVTENYANEEGADLVNKIELWIDRHEYDKEYENLDREELEKIAKEKFITAEPNIIEAYLNVTNPVYRGENETYFDYYEEYDEEYDEYGEPEGSLVDLVEALENTKYEFDFYGDLNVWAMLGEDWYDGMSLSDVADALEKSVGTYLEIMDSEGNYAHKEWLRRALEEMGYDGIIDTTVSDRFNNMNGLYSNTTHYIVFNSNQAKRTDNKTPTDNPDIRFSRDVDIDNTTDLIKENAELQKTVDYLKMMVGRNEERKVNRNSVHKVAVELRKSWNTTMSSDEIAEKLTGLYDYISRGDATWDDVRDRGLAIAREIIAAEKTDISPENKAILADLKTFNISISDMQRSEVKYYYGNVARWMNTVRKGIRYTTDGVALDKAWKELSELYPHLFNEDANSQDQPMLLAEVINELTQKTTDNEYGYSDAEKAEMLMYDIYDEYFNIPEIVTPLDRADKKLAKERIANRERIKKVKARDKAKYDKVVDKYEYRIQRLKEQKNTRERSMLRDKIRKNLNKILSMAANPTKDKHIPNSIIDGVKALAEAITLDNTQYDARLMEKLASFRQGFVDIEGNPDSQYAIISELYNGYISEKIDQLSRDYGKTPLKELPATALKEINDLITMTAQSINNINRLFKKERTATISSAANNLRRELDAKKKDRIYNGTLKGFALDMMKPVYFFEYLDSETMTELYQDLRDGEDIWIINYNQARDYVVKLRKRTGYNDWDFKDKQTFNTLDGKVQLTLQQRLAIYANSLGEHTRKNLLGGGFTVNDKNTKLKEKLGNKLKTKNNASTYRLDENELKQIVDSLTDEQLRYVKGMIKFLSTTCAEWGNDITRQLYGVELYKEATYYPAIIASEYRNSMTDASQKQYTPERQLVHSSFTHSIVPNAANPLVLDDFEQTVAKHIVDMASYNAFVLPLENFDRVYKYNTVSGDSKYHATREYIKNAYGNKATRYIDELMADINGGIIRSGTDYSGKLVSLFKKGAVFASASVVAQQPSAIGRALAILDAKYFLGNPANAIFNKKLYEEMLEYCPIAQIKELGYFDTGMSLGAAESLNAKEYEGIKDKAVAFFTDTAYRDDRLSRPAAKADEITWAHIWNACKKEAADKYGNLSDDEQKQKAAERFKEVITKTQVYDSVFSRAAVMRNKNSVMKMATAFMAEPITSLNMLVNATMQVKRRNMSVGRGAKTLGALAVASMINSVLQSLVTAARHDGDDDDWKERYLAELLPNFLDNANPANQIPFLRDAISIFSGYDVTRADMSLFFDVKKAWDNLSNDNVTIDKKITGMAGAVAAFVGLPVKNVVRDCYAVKNIITDMFDDHKYSTESATALFNEEMNKSIGFKLFADKEKNVEKLYKAMKNGDKEKMDEIIEKLHEQGVDDETINNKIKSELVSNNIDISKAGVAYSNGNMDDFMNAVTSFIAQGYDEKLVKKAIVSYAAFIKNARMYKDKGDVQEYQYYVNKATESGLDVEVVEEAINNYSYQANDDNLEPQLYSKAELLKALENNDMNAYKHMHDSIVATKKQNGKYTSIFSNSDVVDMLKSKRYNDAKTIIASIIELKTLDGVSQPKAMHSIKTSINGEYRDEYIAADETERQQVEKVLRDSGLYKNHTYKEEIYATDGGTKLLYEEALRNGYNSAKYNKEEDAYVFMRKTYTAVTDPNPTASIKSRVIKDYYDAVKRNDKSDIVKYRKLGTAVYGSEKTFMNKYKVYVNDQIVEAEKEKLRNKTFYYKPQ